MKKYVKRFCKAQRSQICTECRHAILPKRCDNNIKVGK